MARALWPGQRADRPVLRMSALDTAAVHRASSASRRMRCENSLWPIAGSLHVLRVRRATAAPARQPSSSSGVSRDDPLDLQRARAPSAAARHAGQRRTSPSLRSRTSSTAERRSWHPRRDECSSRFGALALVVAALGLYGGDQLPARYSARHEFGVRVALGAQTHSIVRLVVGQAVTFASGGAVLGMLLAVGAGRWLQPLLFHESARDPGVFALVTVTMIAVAVLASAVPSLRASRADPMVALKSD